MLAQLRTAVLMLLVLTVLTGVAYPLLVTGIGQVLFHDEARGSLVPSAGAPRGSALIGQPFTDPKYFWSRPSATGPVPCNAAASTGSNLAIGNPAQLDAIRSRVAALRAADPGNSAPIPIDLVTASGSGLDPHISPAAAAYQAPRVARARHIDSATVKRLIDRCTEPRQWGVFGEPRVNVLLLNLRLDDETAARRDNTGRHS